MFTQAALQPLRPVASSQTGVTCVAATALTKPSGAEYALIQALVANIRWRDDGFDPTASAGQRLEAGDSMLYAGDLSAFRFIEEGGGAVANISYYRV